QDRHESRRTVDCRHPSRATPREHPHQSRCPRPDREPAWRGAPPRVVPAPRRSLRPVRTHDTPARPFPDEGAEQEAFLPSVRSPRPVPRTTRIRAGVTGADPTEPTRPTRGLPATVAACTATAGGAYVLPLRAAHTSRAPRRRFALLLLGALFAPILACRTPPS